MTQTITFLKDCEDCKGKGIIYQTVEPSEEYTSCETCRGKCKLSAEISGAEIWKKYNNLTLKEATNLVIEEEKFIALSVASDTINKILKGIGDEMTPKEIKDEIFCCPTCGEKTYDDSIGYSPPVPECRKCNHLCNWQKPEAERKGFSENKYIGYLEGLEKAKQFVLENVEVKE